MSEPKLASCPFCSGAGEFLADIIGPGEVRCVDCDAMVRGDTGIGTIAAWNRRSHPGWAEAREAAAKVAEDHCWNTSPDLAIRVGLAIRALQPAADPDAPKEER